MTGRRSSARRWRPRRGDSARGVHPARSPIRLLRRLLAITCVLWAAVSATQPARPDAAQPSAPTASPGQRVVPVSVVGSDVRSYIDPGDVVELLVAEAADDQLTAGAPRAGDPVTVLSRRATVLVIKRVDEAAAIGESGWQLVVAVDEDAARRIANIGSKPVLAVAGNTI